MADAIKVKLDTLYRVASIDPNFVTNSKPTIEVYSASSNVTVRATTNPDYAGSASGLPVCSNSVAAGDVLVSYSGRHIRFVSFSCSDSSAVILVSGLNLIESPVHKVDTYSVSDAGLNYQVGDVVEVEGDVNATFEVLKFSQTLGKIASASVAEAGSSSVEYPEEVEVAGGEGGVIGITSASETTYKVNAVEIDEESVGADYVAGDVVAISGAAGDTAAQIRIVSVDESGAATEIEIESAGSYASDITGDVSVTGGTGTGLKVVCVCEEIVTYHIDSVSVVSAGSGYEDGQILFDDGAKITYTAGNESSMDVKMLDDGQFDEAMSSSVKETIGGSGEGCKMSLTTKAIY